ncbi:hypothetical protein CMQ_4703 [Grosmannia clavigera kw1407]|uniref:Uncharacterized protein n=1 Tax=Grosmannia clavigera (strain kw1407 / UAMH 11150) TaxID=655863 RepID=F0XUB0_GROCL|nr:uncharacterized protein CMQ_4703 [Grosmannia clavigera kw1407]EFW98851.1 hypothetical protein CMQ_4703 [Grosmannia clavigera kw1407]
MYNSIQVGTVIAFVDRTGSGLSCQIPSEAILGIWSVVEINLGIVCGTAMRLKPFIVTYLPKLNLLSKRSTGRSYVPWKDTLTKADKGQHSYQLHSIQQGSREPVSKSPQGHNIHVHEETNVQVENMGQSQSQSQNRSRSLSRSQSVDDSSVELV